MIMTVMISGLQQQHVEEEEEDYGCLAKSQTPSAFGSPTGINVATFIIIKLLA